MDYIYNINWRRQNRKYYKVYIFYETETKRKHCLKVNFPISHYIKPHSLLGQLLGIDKTVKLSLYYVEKILNESYLEIWKIFKCGKKHDNI